ncbi:hypothetical protein CAPTEDRAFT_59293, partial [Capitella teleta]
QISGLNITSIPEWILEDATDLKIQYTSISTIGNRAFNKWSQLTRLDLSHNNISQIDRGAFRGMAMLSELYLYHNQITEV